MKKYVITDSRIDKRCEEALVELGYSPIKLPPSSNLALPVSAHPDMLVFVSKERLICESEYYSLNSELIDRVADIGVLEILLADENLSPEYPHDVLFNAAPIGDRLICRKSSTSSAILDLYSDDKIIDVRQGYSKCATLTVGDGGLITADPSVAREAEAVGLSVLRIKSHGVRLDGYDCGFIGGASGEDGRYILFCGDLSLHPEGELIADFCRRHGREPISLSNEELYDYGTLMFI